jgi:formylglycine-generating enzyme required for sulfatase activity
MAKGYDDAVNVGNSPEVSVTITGSANVAPTIPSNPNPLNGVTNVLFSLTLSWSCSDPEGYALEYDVYFGTSSSPTTAIKTNYTNSSISQSGLIPFTTYYWMIVARDNKGATTTGPVWSFSTDAVSQGLVQVTGGTFQMGNPTVPYTDASPSHPVILGSFYIDKYEITYEKWTDVRNWGLTHGYTDLNAGQNGNNPSGTNNPVTEINWYDVLKWCNARSEKDGLTPVYYTELSLATVYRTGTASAVKWAADGYRLPTEAEWEYAARGGINSQGYTYSGSDSVGDVAWYSSNSGGNTHTVGTKSANELGIYDMSGNLCEWCWDIYGAYPAATAPAETDPRGAANGIYRVLRGGTYNDGDYIRVYARNNTEPLTRANLFGLRCVKK